MNIKKIIKNKQEQHSYVSKLEGENQVLREKLNRLAMLERR